jgi:hypothetical protein
VRERAVMPEAHRFYLIAAAAVARARQTARPQRNFVVALDWSPKFLDYTPRNLDSSPNSDFSPRFLDSSPKCLDWSPKFLDGTPSLVGNVRASQGHLSPLAVCGLASPLLT